MAENIDGLQIEISADANIAEKSLNRLADSLIKLQSSVGALGNGQFQNLAAGIRQLSDSMERFSGGVKTADFTRIATGLSKLSGVNVQGVSDASRAISTLTTNLSQIGSLAFDSQGIAKIANAIAQLGRKTVTQATANIPLLSMALSGLINEMNGIGTLNFDTKGLSELVAAISKLGGKTATTAASGNIKNLAIALKKMMVTLSTAPKVSQNLIQMTQALAQLASTGGRAGTATASLTRNFNALPSSVHKARSSFNGLAGAIGKFYATYWLLIRGMGQFKKAIDISSSLTEVQNVVDVSFGDMSNKMDEFADSALRLYGMSELTAKQIGSRFQAMGVAMGFAQDEMSDMSIRLTKLAGDLSSFYNISQEQVATKLQSIFTGETEPMRQLGLDLSFATVEAWALAHGIEADMQKMTQAEKTMLRYQYVLANTGAATDDFQRTIGSWANQLRLLTGNFEQLGSIVGGVLVNAFKPFIQALNSVMGAVISFAQVVSDALGAIFGWEYQTGGGVAQDLEFGAGAAEDIEEATGGAAKNAKELNRYIAAWHEVNNMTSNDGGSGGGSGGGGAGGAASGNADGGQWVQAESLWEKYTSDIDSLYELGAYIGEVLTKAMNDIDWDSVYESARNFGTGLASFLNGLISPELFGATGRTIAGALNTAIYAALSFGETFDWKDFGLSIATGINGFFRTFDFASLAQTINVWAKGLLDTVITGIDNTDWEMIGTRIGTFLENIDFLKIGGKIGKAIWKAINAGFDMWKGMFSAAPLETALLSLVGVTKLLKASSIKKFSAALKDLTIIAKNLGGAFVGIPKNLTNMSAAFPGLTKAVNVCGTAFQQLMFGVHYGDWSGGLNQALNTIRTNLTGIQKMAITAVSGFAEFRLVKDSISDLAAGTGSLSGNLAELASGAAIGAAGMFTAFGKGGLAFAAVTGLISVIAGLDDAISEIAQNSAIGLFADAIEEVSNRVSSSNEQIAKNLESTRESIESAGAAQTQMAQDLAKEYENLSSKSTLTADEQARLQTVSEQLIQIVPGLSGYFNEQAGILQVESDTLADLIENMDLYAKQQALQEGLTEAYKNQYDAIKNVRDAQADYDAAAQTFIESTEGMSASVKNMIMEGDLQGLRDLKEQLWDVEQSHDKLEKAFGESAVNGRAVDKMLESLEESLSGYSLVLDEANALEIEAKDNVKFYTDELTNNTQALKTNEENMLAGKKATDEFKQAVADIATEFENMDLAISGEFAESLAFDDTGMVDSIVSMFSEMKNQVQLSSAELQQLFSDIAPGISSEFAEALSNESANMQLEVSMTLANLASGAEVDSEAVKAVFSAIGFDLPNEIIESFAEQESPLQVSTFNLLSKIDDGKSLIEGNLVQVFNNLGLEVSDSVIEALSSKEPETQQQAIELLAQISAAEESERPGLISKFNSLGLGIADEGIIKAFNDKQADTTEATNSFFKTSIEDVLVSKKPPIYNQSYEDGSQVVSGVNQGISDNQSSTRGVISTWVSKITGWFEGFLGIHSPSRIFAQFGQYTVEGFNHGLEDNLDSSYSLIDNWSSGILKHFDGKIPTIDVSVDTSKYKFNPPSINGGKISGQIQEELDYMFAAGGFIDYDRLGEAVYRAQSQAMKENPVQIGDKDVFSAAQRQQRREYRRTFKTGWAGID